MALVTVSLDTGQKCECSCLRIISSQVEEKKILVGSSPYLYFKALDSLTFNALNL